jgi:hypothetical protein
MQVVAVLLPISGTGIMMMPRISRAFCIVSLKLTNGFLMPAYQPRSQALISWGGKTLVGAGDLLKSTDFQSADF